MADSVQFSYKKTLLSKYTDDSVYILCNQLFTKLTGCSSLRYTSHEIVNGCWTLCYCDPLHFRNSQRNELWSGKCWNERFLKTNFSVLSRIVHIHRYRLWIDHVNLFSEKAQTEMQICHWALELAFHIVCIWS